MVDIYAPKIKRAIDALKPRSLSVDILHVRLTTVFNDETQEASVTEVRTKATAIISSQTTVAPDGIRVVERVFKIPGASLRIAPVAGDIIRHAGRDYVIARVTTKQPGGIPLIHEVVVAD